MYLSILFWLALALPGYAVVRRFWPDDLKSGLLGTISVSYLASLALLSPVSILCYVGRAPLAVFSVTCILAILLAAFDLSRQKAWRPLGSLLIAALGVELLIVILDMALGARNGAFISGDARIHLARIRLLIDHGFSNDDPSVAARCFFPIYHTNLLHALFAACCQITRQDHIGVWFVSLAWAKLLITSGLYYLAWTVFDRQWPAWIAAMFAIGHRGPVDFLIYPNQLSPYWLAPLALAFALAACRSSVRWRDAIRLGAVSLILGQMHALYVFFAAIMIGPLLAGAAVLAVIRGRRVIALRQTVCTAALAAGIPFILISRSGSVVSASPAPASVHADKDLSENFTPLAGTRWMRKPESAADVFGGGAWAAWAMGACLLAALYDRRRSEVLMLLVAPAVAAAVLYTPAICTFMLRHAREAWILLRIDFIFQVILIVLGVPALAAFIEPKIRSRFVRSLISLAAIPAALPFSNYGEPWTWREMLARARAPADIRMVHVNGYRRIMNFLREHAEPGSVILTSLKDGLDLVMMTDCHVVAPVSAANGVPDWDQRKKDIALLLSADLPWEKRRELLRQYHVKYFLPTEPPVEWVRGHVVRHWECKPFMLMELNTN